MKHAAEARRDSKANGAERDAEAKLAELRRELDRFRRIFDSARLIVGHELAKPLTSASGYLDLLEERRGDSFDDRDRAYIAKIRGSFARLGELVEAFVEMLRVERETGDPGDEERVDIRALAEAVRGRFPNERERIVLRVGPDVPRVVARRRCIEIVLENLVSNAVKHGGGEPVIVAVSLAESGRSVRNGDRLTITVEDRGAGIPEDKIEEIFMPFFRLDDGKKRDGLGLGLALVQNVVRAVGGEIGVRSTTGEGTKVTVVMPVTRDGALVLDTIG